MNVWASNPSVFLLFGSISFDKIMVTKEMADFILLVVNYENKKSASVTA